MSVHPSPRGDGPPPRGGQSARAGAAAAAAATAPARWLLDAGSEGGVALTATFALSRAVVREAAERWPGWWDAELFGPPSRQAELPVLEALHDGLRRMRLVRRRARKLHTTARGRELAADPPALLRLLAEDLGAGDGFSEAVARTVSAELATRATRDPDELLAPVLREVQRGGWRGSDGEPPSAREVSWVVGEVLCRGEAYGVFERRPRTGRPRFRRREVALTRGSRAALRLGGVVSQRRFVLVFAAELINARRVGASLAVSEGQHLTALHDAIQEAFGWDDGHLYSFWLDGEFWGAQNSEFARPGIADGPAQTAAVPLAELDLSAGDAVAYIFDYGEEWRVRLTLGEKVQSDGGAYPRVLDRTGSAPAQYP